MGLFDNVAGAFKGVFGEAEANASRPGRGKVLFMR